MRLIFVLVFTFITLYAKETNWQLKQFNIYFENDLFSRTDGQYSSGEKFSFLYYIDQTDLFVYDLFLYDDPADNYINFAIVNQIFTPYDIAKRELIVDDRPYAGWTFFETGFHKSTHNTLQSLYIQVGMVGPTSQAEDIQRFIHELTGSELPQGWDNQLKDELGINLRYVHNWRASYTLGGADFVVIPYTEVDLGNISIQALGGLTARFGWNLPDDFGMSTIATGSETGIMTYGNVDNRYKLPWSFTFNFNISGAAIARDIFLDGNTFVDSHSIDKNYAVGSVGGGFRARYKRVALDYYYQKHTKHYDNEKTEHGYGSVIVSILF
jgi:hypothetical protein